jgi:hypothetical protein
MNRHAIFVDAGYFFAAGAEAAFAKGTPRKQVSLKSPVTMLNDLCAMATAACDNLPLLRVYWYDAMPGPRLTLEQSALALLPRLKLRLGALNSAGEQKGVDSLIVTDLIELARNHAIADAVVVAGDEDLRIAVQVAQSFGVRVHLLAAGAPSQNVSVALQMEADSIASLDSAWFSKHFELIQAKAVASAPADLATSRAPGPAPENLHNVALTVIGATLDGMASSQIELLAKHFSVYTTVPEEHDRPLIAKVSAALSNRRFTGTEMREVRGMFVRAVKERLSKSS